MSDYSELRLSPIGVVRSRERYRYETPRQGVFAANAGKIELLPDAGFEPALEGLAGFERIWVVFKFHLNQTWKAKVSPPVISPSGRKVGVFASRSPHRPNPIGMSCVELTGIEGLTLNIANFDMLDGTPVYDIKPYVPKADAFPAARAGWVDETEAASFEVVFSSLFLEQNFLVPQPDLANFCRVQLAVEPLDSRRKRLSRIAQDEYEIACRTWRIRFRLTGRRAEVLSLRSGYAADELASPEDPYGDKDLHRAFISRWPHCGND